MNTNTWLTSVLTGIACFMLGCFVVIYLDERVQSDFMAACEMHQRHVGTWPLSVLKSLAAVSLAQMFLLIWLGIRHGWLKKKE